MRKETYLLTWWERIVVVGYDEARILSEYAGWEWACAHISDYEGENPGRETYYYFNYDWYKLVRCGKIPSIFDYVKWLKDEGKGIISSRYDYDPCYFYYFRKRQGGSNRKEDPSKWKDVRLMKSPYKASEEWDYILDEDENYREIYFRDYEGYSDKNIYCTEFLFPGQRSELEDEFEPG